MKLSKRLYTVASLIPEDAILLDVGCDHALLGIYLKETRPVLKIYACDINKKPLEVAAANIEKHNLDKEIILYQANGLENIKEDVNTIVISGMGTKTIIEILKNGNLSNITTLVLASNLDYEELRKYVTKYYFIEEEQVVKENNKYYVIIKFKKGLKKYSKQDYKYGPILRKKKDDLTREYFEQILNKKLDIIKNLKKHFLLKLKIKKEIRELKKII